MKKKTTRTITNHSDEKVQVTLEVDFTNCSKDEIADWALSNRVIVGQKVWRELSADEIRKNVDGQVFNARTIGQKVESKEKKIRKIMDAFRVSKEVATYMVEQPDKLNSMIDKAKNE